MTNASGAEPRVESGKSLKEQNRWQIWIIVAANSLFLYGVVKANAINSDGLRAALMETQNLVPMGFALVIATLLNGLLSADMKSRLVFLRWHHALPGHRAFSKYVVRDARIDLAALEKLHGGLLPVDPVEQNRAWYRIYKTMENDQAVRQGHRDFLLLRDYSGLSALFIVLYGVTGLYAIPSGKVGLGYLCALVVQYLVVRQAASNYGIRTVTTVLARRVAREGADAAKTPTKRPRRETPENAAKKPSSK